MGSEVSKPVCIGIVIVIFGIIFVVGTYVPMKPLADTPRAHLSLQEQRR